jgi:gamma-glutamyltranspeptidase/glutathione hydrolase
MVCHQRTRSPRKSASTCLKAGGSAVDAAIAANATLGLMEPTGNGIGGDLYAIVWERDGQKTLRPQRLRPLPARPLARPVQSRPRANSRRHTIPPRGFLPISVPGAVDGWTELHSQKFGKLPLKAVLAPAIRYARAGFSRSPNTSPIGLEHRRPQRQARQIARRLPRPPTRPNGNAPAEGQIFKNPDARPHAHRSSATGGRDAFYQAATIAEKIDTFMRAHGGYLRAADLAQHTSTWVDPVSVNYRGYDIYELPPNGQGIAALQMLNILEDYDLARLGYNSPEALHAMIEAKKLAFEDRAKFYADADFSKIPLRGLLSKTYAAERRKLIGARAAKTYDSGHPALRDGDTIYLCTADAAGNMVSLIQSNYRGMGSGIVVPGLGFAFQDRGEMFTLEPGHANVYAPGKRPFHTIIPGFAMKDGQPWQAFGVMGGGMQPQGHVQVLVNQIDFGMNIQEAGDAARWQHEGSSDYDNLKMTDGGYVEVESGVPFESVRGLTQRGHVVRIGNGGFGGYQAIARDAQNGTLIGASESRKDGHAAGY